ncbi:MAG: glycoside hydrolase family 97 N-terminal domain-containing protein [Phycisphaerales bacterium]|nr:MAG: glycoside hydrolase family 97 N-terminal domain-containing protein [Phycisphaerales bacterium]
MQPAARKYAMIVFVIVLCLTPMVPASAQQRNRQPRSRRSQRGHMEEVQVVSPDGNIRITILRNPERLVFTVTSQGTTVLDPSTIVMKVDGYDLSAGIVLGHVRRHERRTICQWRGAKRVAEDHGNVARLFLQHGLSFIDYVLEICVLKDAEFNNVDAQTASDVPTFVLKQVEDLSTHRCGPVPDVQLDHVDRKEL